MFYIRFDSPSHLHASLRRTPNLLEGTSHIVMDGHIYSINQSRKEILPLSATDIQATGFQNRLHVPLFVPGESQQAQIIHQIVFEPNASTEPDRPQRPPQIDDSTQQEQQHDQQSSVPSPAKQQPLTFSQLANLTKRQLQPMLETRDQRFSNIAIPQASAVAIILNGYHIAGLIHANHIGHPSSSAHLIASQYPSPQKRVHYYFWRMALQQNTHLFVDLTSPQEQHHLGNTYYPQRIGDSRFIYELQITRLINSPNGLHQYQVFNRSTGDTTIVSRAHYVHWSNSGSIPVDDLRQLATMINDQPQAIVHCLAGVGRSGTLLAAAILMTAYEQGELRTDNCQQILTTTLLQLRRQRGPQTVQTATQFALLQSFIQHLLTTQK